MEIAYFLFFLSHSPIIPDSWTNLFAGSFFSMEMTTSSPCPDTDSKQVVVINFQCSAGEKVVRSPLSLKQHPIVSPTPWINLVIFVSWSNAMQWSYMLYCGPSRELKKNGANFQSYYMAESARAQDEAGPVFWLVNRAGEMALYCRFRTSRVDSSRKILFGSSIDQAYWVKMAKNWPGFFCVFIDLDFVLNIKMPIKKTGPLSNHLYRTRTVNNAYILT